MNNPPEETDEALEPSNSGVGAQGSTFLGGGVVRLGGVGVRDATPVCVNAGAGGASKQMVGAFDGVFPDSVGRLCSHCFWR